MFDYTTNILCFFPTLLSWRILFSILKQKPDLETNFIGLPYNILFLLISVLYEVRYNLGVRNIQLMSIFQFVELDAGFDSTRHCALPELSGGRVARSRLD